MQVVIILVHLMIVLAMIGVVLLQKSEGGGLGIGSTGGFLSSRGTANVLTRTTAALAIFFFATSLLLSILAGWDQAALHHPEHRCPSPAADARRAVGAGRWRARHAAPTGAAAAGYPFARTAGAAVAMRQVSGAG